MIRKDIYSLSIKENPAKIVLLNPISNMIELDILSSKIPFTYYVINNDNNRIDWITNLTQYSATISPGNYSGAELSTILQTELQAAGLGSEQVVYNPNNYKLSFEDVSNIQILFISTIRDIIGITADTALAPSVTSQNTISLNGTEFLHICSDALSNGKISKLHKIYHEKHNNTNRIFSQITTSNPGQFHNFIPKSDQELYYNENSNNIGVLDFTLKDDNNKILDLNGQDYSFQFSVKFKC